MYVWKTISILGTQIHTILVGVGIVINSKKVNTTIGLLHRILSSWFKVVTGRAYLTLVRPQLEYDADAWNAKSTTSADRLEHNKRAAITFVEQDYGGIASGNNLINILGWDQLHNIQLVSHLTMHHRKYYRLVNILMPQLFSPVTIIDKHDHQLKYAFIVATIES